MEGPDGELVVRCAEFQALEDELDHIWDATGETMHGRPKSLVRLAILVIPSSTCLSWRSAMALKTATKTRSAAPPKTKPQQKATRGQPAPATKAASAPKPKTAAIVTIKHLAATLAERHEIPQKQAGLLLTNLVEVMNDHLKKGDRLRINGLGILEVKNRAARQGRNPATGETIQIKASKKIAFRPAKELKEAI